MARIFLSYRRDDSADVSGRIRDRLVDRFGAAEVFTDVDSIPYGVDFRGYIDQKVAQCDIFIAVIGPDWLTASDAGGERRLTQADDFVRLEVESALNRDIPVVPLLVRKAAMPAEDELPEGIRALAYRNGTPIRPDPDFHKDMDRLIHGLMEHLPENDAVGGLAQRRRPGRLIAILAVGVVLLAAVVLTLSQRGGSPEPVPPVRNGPVIEEAATSAQFPIEQIRAQVVIRADRNAGVVDNFQGKPRRHYSVWIDAPREVMQQIARVEYRYPEQLFSPAVRSSTDRASGFRDTYLGIGAVYDMEVVLILQDGRRISLQFDMYHAIFPNNSTN